MQTHFPSSEVHPAGEPATVEGAGATRRLAVDRFGGRVHVEWDPDAPVTPLGQLSFFIEYLRLGGLFDSLATDCPVVMTSPNAPAKRDVLGTLLFVGSFGP
jgi:hypothetical protein